MTAVRLFTILLILSTIARAQPEAQSAFSEGVKQLRARNYTEAEKSFSIAIEKWEKEEDGLKMSYVFKGKALNGQGKFNEAIICFNKSIEIDSLDPATFTDRGMTYGYQTDYANAILDFKHVLTLDSLGKQAEAAYYYLGKIYMMKFENELAISYFDTLINLVPTDSEAYFLRGTTKSNNLDSEGAIADFDRAIELRPNYMEALANRGVQKINKLPVDQKTGNRIKCLEDPCADLLKAKSLGDNSIDDMIFIYCKKCK